MEKISRNQPCPCGSGKKYKKCCYLKKPATAAAPPVSAQALLDDGLKRYRAGHLPEAEALYKQALKIEPNNTDALHLLGLIARDVGKNDIAVQLIKQAITLNPAKAIYHNNLGNALKACGKLTDAINCYQTAIQTDPGISEFFNGLGNALQELGDLEQAGQNFRRAIALNPVCASYYFNLANLLQLQKNYPAAITGYQQAIVLKPDYWEAYGNLGVAFKESGKPSAAIDCYRNAIAINSNYPQVYNNLGVALLEQGKLDAAVDCYQKSLALRPSAQAYDNLGVALKDQGRLSEALQSFQAALAMQPNDSSAFNNLGTLFEKQNKLDDAIACYQKALAINPRSHLAHNNLGNVLKGKNLLAEAITHYQTSLRIKPDYSAAHSNLYHAQLHGCDWTDYHHHLERAKQAVLQGDSQYSPFSFLSICDSPRLQQQCALNFTAAKYPLSEQPLWTGQRYQHDKIRVAYLSADFHAHATAYLMAELFEIHDKNRFEIIAVSFGPDDNSAIRERLKQAFTQFITVNDKSDYEIALMLRNLEIDIAVDLKGYTKDSRPGILAYRPAPIQVNYLGYPGTMGADYIDYILADQHVIPKDQQCYYTENVVYLPHCYQVNDSKREIAESIPTRAEVGLPEQGFVFCCFNNNYKINPAVFDVWMRLLSKIEGSVLWLLQDNVLASQNLQREAVKRQVDPKRLIFAPRAKLPEHLARHKLADLFLDTLPVNAHTTASDALWAGLPVLTCTGPSFAGRVAGSLLTAIGLEELITETQADYEVLALKLATTPALLAQIRGKLATNRLTQPLFNTALFCQALEQAFLKMWQNSRPS